MVAIDLGSNTLRGVEMECRSLEPAAWFEKIVRTADGIHKSGRISEEAVVRIVEALNEAKGVLDFSQPVAAVTTQALRKASNAEEVLNRIRSECGIDFRVIGGEEEAYYTLLAVKNRLEKIGMESDNFVMADLGGGSTEILFFDSGRVESRSFDIGIVTVAQKYGSAERIGQAMPHLTKDLRRFAESMRAEGFDPKLFVSTAGTPTTVAAMKLGMSYATYDAKKINGTTLQRADLKIQMDRLLSLDEESRRELVGVGREDLIAAGITILDGLYSLLGFDESVVIDDGLREGVAIAACLGFLERPGDLVRGG